MACTGAREPPCGVPSVINLRTRRPDSVRSAKRASSPPMLVRDQADLAGRFGDEARGQRGAGFGNAEPPVVGEAAHRVTGGLQRELQRQVTVEHGSCNQQRCTRYRQQRQVAPAGYRPDPATARLSGAGRARAWLSCEPIRPGT